MRIEVNKAQAGFIMLRIAPEVIRYLQCAEPTPEMTAAYENIHKPIYDQLRKRSIGDEL